MFPVEEFLQPISAESPCGEDIAYDPHFLELDKLILGKAETQFSAAEEPNWKVVRDTCVELLARSKHLRVATTLCLALVKLEGCAGLRDGLALLKGLLDHYWPDLFPKLDPEDGLDPLERVNVIAALANPLGTFGDPMRFLQRVREMPLTNSSRAGRYGVAQLADGAEAGAVSPAQAVAAFRDTSPEELQAASEALGESIASVRGIDDFLTETVGSNRAPDLGALVSVLAEAQKCLAPYVEQAGEVVEGGALEAGPRAASVPAGEGAIGSRADVILALDRICQFYRKAEPSSPVPLLLLRARRLVDMDFAQIIADLAPDAMGQISAVTGRGESSGEADQTGASTEQDES